MTKNGTNSANSKQTVSVQSQGGENIGLTYPKRAAGLVKKGAGRFVNDQYYSSDGRVRCNTYGGHQDG